MFICADPGAGCYHYSTYKPDFFPFFVDKTSLGFSCRRCVFSPVLKITNISKSPMLCDLFWPFALFHANISAANVLTFPTMWTYCCSMMSHKPVTPVLGYRSWKSSSGMMPWRTLPPFSGRGGTGARLWDDVCKERDAWIRLWWTTWLAFTQTRLIAFAHIIIHITDQMHHHDQDIPSSKGSTAFQGTGCKQQNDRKE